MDEQRNEFGLPFPGMDAAQATADSLDGEWTPATWRDCWDLLAAPVIVTAVLLAIAARGLGWL